MSFLFIIFIIYLLFSFINSKIHIDIKTFFKKGFKKLDNAFGLYCYTGKQGKGKTYSAIKFLIEQKIEHNYIILTNVKSFNAFEDTLYFKTIDELIDKAIELTKSGKKIIIFFDEIFTILEKKTPMNKKILSFISQLRKRQIVLVTTAQEWSEINITFRRYVRFQISCNMFSLPFLHTAFIFNSINDGDLIYWDNDQQEFIAPRISANFSKGNLSIIKAYDTFETIHTG